ncbi:hypothetical protein IMZ48_19320, partial [Candidatus Bathyarchaeota archaeon]|nr:hypothetical protein [Candidatus Bathyarchaeota archaeon]
MADLVLSQEQVQDPADGRRRTATGHKRGEHTRTGHRIITSLPITSPPLAALPLPTIKHLLTPAAMALPPATSGIFSFAGDSLFVESSGKNLHRRSTIPELKAHFDASADRPAHWYEAQLIHYGLPSSRVKGTAKMRLYDAVKGKGLVVPGHMKTMETDLKKLWKKQGKGGQAGVNPAPPVAPSTNKRKANAAGEAPAAKAPKKNATSTPRKTTASKTSTAPSTNATSQAAHPTTTPTAQSKPKQT